MNFPSSGTQPGAQPLTTYLYSGESFDFRIGQQYLRARWYDATTGRFNRLDPFAGNSSDPQSFHKYAYVHGDPVQGVDPTGQFLGLLGWTSLYVNAAFAVYDAFQTIKYFSDTAESINSGHPYKAIISYLSGWLHAGLTAIDIAAVVATISGGSGPGNLAPQLAGGGTMVLQRSIVGTIKANRQLILEHLVPAALMSRAGIIAMSASGNGPWWHGPERWSQKVARAGNGTWHMSGKGSPNDRRLPEYVSGPTFGIIDLMGGEAKVSSTSITEAFRSFQAVWSQLSRGARIAATHAEGQGVAAMQKLNVDEGIMSINQNTPCDWCISHIGSLLKPGQTLEVHTANFDRWYFEHGKRGVKLE